MPNLLNWLLPNQNWSFPNSQTTPPADLSSDNNLQIPTPPSPPPDVPQATASSVTADSNPNPAQYPNEYIASQKYAQAPAVQGNTDQVAWQTALNEIRTKMESNNKLISAKNAVFKHMYDQPLTAEEKSALTPSLAHAISTGNTDMISAAIKGVNAQIKGYNDTIDTNLSAYATAVSETNKLQESSRNQILEYRKAGLDVPYTGEQIQGMGLDPTQLGYVKNSSVSLSVQEGAYAGECGHFVNQYIGSNIFGDSIGQKESQTNSNTPVVGSAAVIDTGDAYGHVAVVEKINNDGTINVVESNWNNDGRITRRTIDPGSVYGYYVPQNKPAGSVSYSESQWTVDDSAGKGDLGTMSGFFTDGSSPDNTISSEYIESINSTPAALYQDALTYAYAGPTALSGMGLGQAKQVSNYRAAVKVKAAGIANSLGMDEFRLRALFKANEKGATQIISRVGKIEATSAALQSQFPRLSELAEEVKKEGINLTESDIQAGSTIIMQKFGSTVAANYGELLQTVRGDYQAYLQALGGGRGGEYLEKDSSRAIPAGYTGEQYRGLQETILKSADVSLKATQDTANMLLGIDDSTQTSSQTQDQISIFDNLFKQYGGQ